MTHTRVEHQPKELVVAVMLDLIVDRNVGRTIHNQWVQPPESTFITGFHLHVLNLNDVFTKGFSGFYRVNTETLQSLF